MKGKAIIPLALGLCVGLVAVKFGVDAIKKAQGSAPAQTTVPVVTARMDIDVAAEITPEMVEVVDVPDSVLAPAKDRIASVEDVQGRVTAKAIPQRAPILVSMLAPPGTPAGMVGRIPAGFRAVSVKIDEVTGVAYQIKPGDWVDVIVVMDVQSTGRGRKKQTIAEVILQNVQVAAIGQDTAGAAGAGAGSAKVKPARSATLLVSEEDAPKLHLAATRGKITLAMRGDDNSTSDKLTTLTDTEAFAFLREEERLEAEERARQEEAERQAELARRAALGTGQVAAPVDPEQPHSVVVHRGSTQKSARPSTERLTFENARSSNVIGVYDGLAGGAAATLKARAAPRFKPPLPDPDDGVDQGTEPDDEGETEPTAEGE